MASFSLILEIQDRVADRLRRIPELSGTQGAKVVARKRGQTSNDVEAALAELGLGFFVFRPRLRKIRPNSTGLFAEQIEVRVSAFEHPGINNLELDVARLAELGLFYLHHWDPVVPGVSMLYADDEGPQEASTPKAEIEDLTFFCSGGFEARPAHV